jgi:predicted ATP-dependent serine protease
VSGKPGNEIDPLLEEYTKWRTAESLDVEQERTIQRGTPLKEITKLYTPDNLIRVYPLSLNDRLDGGMLRGQHMVVFARPEMGKTLFLVNAVAGFLSQNLTVLYVGNEDPADDITLRIVCRLTKRNKFEVLDNVEDADIEARKRGYNNLIMAGLTPGSPGEIEELTREYKPDVVLIDQLRNLRMREDNYVRQLEKAATAIRTIGKRLGVFVVSVTQAGDSASGKAVLDMGDVDSSNTGIPAQADVMVGIGATQEDLEIGRRVLSLPKNKRSGRHEYFPVNIDTQTNRMFSVGATSE